MKRPGSWKSIHAMKRRSRGLNESATPEFVTIRDDVPLPVITAYRLLASRIAPHHPILLKDTLGRPEE